MNCQEVERLILSLKSTLQDVHTFAQKSTTKESSYLAEYLTVMSCGIFEECIEQLIFNWASTLNDTRAKDFIVKHISHTFKNPTREKIIELLGKFDNNWCALLKTIDTKYTSAIDSIVNHKNALAHKGSTTITFSEAEDYINRAIVVIESLDQIII